MCRSVSEGGQRCAAHTREKVAAVVARIEDAAAAGDMAAVAEARGLWEDAAAEFASTNEGRDLYRAQAAHADAAGDVDTAALLNTIVARGEAMRAANRETAALLAAIRMPENLPAPAPVVPSTAEMALSPATAATPAGPAVSAVPLGREALTDDERQMLADVTAYLDEVEPYIGGGLRGPYFRTGAQISKAVDVFEDPSSTDHDLAEAFATVHKLQRLPYLRPDQNTLFTGVRGSYATKQKIYDRLTEKLNAIKDSGPRLADDLTYGVLDHPNVGVETLTAVSAFGAGLDLQRITDRPTFPLPLLKDVLMKEPDNGRTLADSAWQRLREARLNDNSVAMVLAMSDPDSYQRNDAVIALEMADMDSFTREERTWLANHLGRLPGGPEKKIAIAHSLAAWAKGFGDARDRSEIALAFRPGSGLPAETVRLHEDLHAFDRPQSVEVTKPRRGWLAR